MANAQVQLSFIENNRGGQMLVFDNYTFHVKQRKEDRCYWRCTTRTCGAAINTHNNILTKVSANHNHPPDEGRIAAKKFISQVKKRCRDTTEPIPALYEEELASLRTPEWDDTTRQTAEQIPTYHSCKSGLYRNRLKTKPPIPNTREEIVLEGKWSETTAGDRFLLHDDGGPNRQLIFATTENLEELAAADVWYCDGTFYSSPKHFRQLYTIHALINGEMFPFVFGLLPDKREDTYASFFRNLHTAAEERHIHLNPHRVMMDFEAATRNAVLTVFPMAEVKGCFFHFTQCLWRKIQGGGLQTQFREDDDFKRLARRASALPLVPLESVEDVWFQALEEHDHADDATTRFKDYVTETWVEGDKRTWNHFDTEGPRTTNHLEGWHHKVNNQLTHPHPNIFVMVELIQRIQATNEMKILQYAAGGARPTKRRKYRDIETRLAQMKGRLNRQEVDMMQYTDAVSFLLHLGQ